MYGSLIALGLSFSLGFLALRWFVGPALFSVETYHLNNPKPNIIAFCFITLLAHWIFPVLRFKLLCSFQNLQLTFFTSLTVHLSTIFGALTMPGNAGGTPVLIFALRRLGLPFGAGFAIVAQLILLDLAYFALLVPLSVFYAFHTELLSLPKTILSLVLALSTLFFLVGVLLSFFPQLGKQLLSYFGKQKWVQALTKRINQNYRQSISRFGTISIAQRFNLHLLTMLSWLTRSAFLWGLLILFDVHTLLINILASLNIINLLSNFMPTPGGSGFVEIAIGWSLRAEEVETTLIAGPILLWRLLTYYINFLLGPLAILLLYKHLKKVR